ncbi:Hemolysin, contains CBS domains [Halopseudomonas litoralis]|uniref:Polyamine export protein n=1 Tax=Halopseudomonas litoralis TaxID=797277 RepID=A0A1H1WR82_9GAMM|nr:hemolysin family protein [Halopseudomonas litoralis]SDS99584.1 Hemolysin, contains CBS domains [Halopseudomonas litoralis]
MSFSQSLLLLAAIILGGAFLSIAEISLAAARPLKLRQMADNGTTRALHVIAVQQNPGNYLTVVQISINALAILGGIVGEEFLTALFTQLFLLVLEPPLATTLGFAMSFLILTSLFIVVTDLIPKQVAMALPEPLAVFSIGPMRVLNILLRPLVWFYSRLVSGLIKLLRLPARRDDEVTPEDILALTEAGARSGLLAPGEQQAIENIFELDTRTLPSAMSTRDEIEFFLVDDSDALIRSRIADTPHSAYPVCEGDIDHIIGYVSMKDLFKRVLHNEPISLSDPTMLHKPLVVPDRLTLAELLKQFRQVGEDFALIVNEYSLVVGLITVNDVMSIVMGDLVPPWYEEQIVRRDDNSWLIDGITPIQDVRRALEIEDIPQEEGYETLAGFMMAMLRRVPRRTDRVIWGEYTFEVVDVDSYRIDQVLATRTLASGVPLEPPAPQ